MESLSSNLESNINVSELDYLLNCASHSNNHVLAKYPHAATPVKSSFSNSQFDSALWPYLAAS